MRMTRLYRAHGPADIYLLRDFLARHGVPSELRGESLRGLAGAIPVPDTFPSLWVRDVDLENAVALLKEFEGPKLVHPDWLCTGCGETNAPTFEFCWNCETSRPY